MDYVGSIKERLLCNARKLGGKKAVHGKERKNAFIFDELGMNFHDDSLKEIQDDSAWLERTRKKHTQINGIFEMQSSNSSDALLMNIFCHPEIRIWEGPKKLLRIHIDKATKITFGWEPVLANEKRGHKTEVDLKIGSRIFEAKLTEPDFQTAPAERVRGYEGFTDVFDESRLSMKKDRITNYQLIRNALVAYKYGLDLTVLLDSSRIDLIREIFKFIKAIKLDCIRDRIDFVTWQELNGKLGEDLDEYIYEKYLAPTSQ